MALFYVFAIGSVVLLGWGALEAARWDHHGNVGLAAVAAGALGATALIVAWSVVPRGIPFSPPGPALIRGTHPALFEEVEHIARDTGQKMPDRIYLLNDVNAFVAQTGVWGLNARRVLAIGLPLRCALDMQQLRCVLGHEFGHLSAGDTRLLPWVYRARLAMISVVNNLATVAEKLGGLGLFFRIIGVPFRAFALSYIRFTQGLSREQELAADAMGAKLAGALHSISALRITEACAVAFNAYFHSELKPVLQLGHLPPVAEGFRRFLATPYGHSLVPGVEPRERSNPFDSHPPLVERVAALQRMTVPRAGRDDRPAIALLNELPGYELALMRHLIGEAAMNLKSVAWSGVGAVMATQWLERGAAVARALASKHFEDLPLDIAGQRALLARLFGRERSDANDAQVRDLAFNAFLQLVFAGLCTHGLKPEWVPGEPERFYAGKKRYEPRAVVLRLVEGRLNRGQWSDYCHETGLAEVDVELLAAHGRSPEDEEADAA
jgi:Zn-dependent protease with chaperone function